jgi:hypothetical protein
LKRRGWFAGSIPAHGANTPHTMTTKKETFINGSTIQLCKFEYAQGDFEYDVIVDGQSISSRKYYRDAIKIYDAIINATRFPKAAKH